MKRERVKDGEKKKYMSEKTERVMNNVGKEIIDRGTED